MRILVTGLDGFTGRYAEAELKVAGHEVIGLSSDLRDLEAVRAEVKRACPNAVMHLAAQAFVGHGNANEFYDINLIGTKNLLDALDGSAVESVLLASSANIYGNQSEGSLDEATPPRPANDYAVSKLAMEHMARVHGGGLPIFITRPFNYTGVGQAPQFLIPKIVGHFRDRAPVIELGNINVFREFGDVRGVVAAYRKLIETPPVGEALNICTGQPHALRDVISMCEEITGHFIKITVNPAFVRANEVKTLTGDPSKLRAVLGDWNPRNLRETLSWMLDEKAARN